MKRFGINRRRLLQGAAGATLASSVVPRRVRAQSSGPLRVRLPVDIANVDPAYYGSRSETNIIIATQLRLIEYKATESWEWELQAAESIGHSDPTHIEFTLRDGLEWTGDFGEITTEDVKYSFERIIDPAFDTAYKDELFPLDHVEIIDKRRGVLVLSEPSASIWSYLPWWSASIICKKATEALPDQRWTVEPPACGGPYTIASWKPKQELVMVYNERYYGPKPEFEEVRFIPIDDDKTAELALLAGDLDFTEVSISSVPELQANPPQGASMMLRPNLGVRWMGMNTETPPLDDPRVRRAIQLSVDVDGLLEAAFFGAAPRATGVIPPGMIGYRDSNIYGERDVAKAKQLLAEAGHPDGVKVTLTVVNSTDMNALAQFIQANAAEAGIEVEINSLESGLFWVQGIESEGDHWKTLQLFIHNWGWAPDPSSATMWYTPDQIGNWNWERWNSPEFLELHRQGLVELDPAKRGEIYSQMMDLMEESGAYLFLTPGVNPLLYRDTIVPAVSPDGRRYYVSKFTRAA